MNNTPRSNRLHIAVFGRRNSGKSSLVNALTGQDTALVSATPGTTTDPVTKAMEVYPLGPCLFIDTPGFDDDEGELGGMRVERTLKTVEKADIALLLYEADGTLEQQWLKLLAAREIPVILILNKADSRQDTASVVLRIEKECGQAPVVVSAKEGTGIQGIFDAILEKLPENFGEQTITGNLVSEGDVVLLVMPQDIQAPKGRLILPQVQTIRLTLHNISYSDTRSYHHIILYFRCLNLYLPPASVSSLFCRRSALLRHPDGSVPPADAAALSYHFRFLR